MKNISKIYACLFVIFLSFTNVNAANFSDNTKLIIVHPHEEFDSPPNDYAQDMIKEFGYGNSKFRLGFGVHISTFNHSEAEAIKRLRAAFDQAKKNDLPLFIHVDNEWFIGGRPDIWNWFDPKLPGYNPDNKYNVEWTGWDQPIKEYYLNWGRAIRLDHPRLCFGSPKVRNEIQRRAQDIGAELRTWLAQVGPSKKYLFAGIDPGWETGILNYSKSAGIPAEGRVNMGFCSLHHRGFSASKPPADMEKELQKAVYDFIQFESQVYSKEGLSKDQIFTHVVGFEGTPNAPVSQRSPLDTAFNSFSTPGFSLYPGAFDFNAVKSSIGNSPFAIMEAPPNQSVDDYKSWINFPNLKLIVLYSWSANMKVDKWIKNPTEPSQAQAINEAAKARQYLKLLLSNSVSQGDHTVVGIIDSVTMQGNEQIVTGWACAKNHSSPIDIHVYAGNSLIQAFKTHNVAEPGVLNACQVSGRAMLRFGVAISNNNRKVHAGKPIILFGISPFGEGNNRLGSNGKDFLIVAP